MNINELTDLNHCGTCKYHLQRKDGKAATKKCKIDKVHPKNNKYYWFCGLTDTAKTNSDTCTFYENRYNSDEDLQKWRNNRIKA